MAVARAVSARRGRPARSRSATEPSGARTSAEQPAGPVRTRRPSPPAEEAPAEPAPAPEPEPEPQEEAPAEQPASGADLNQQGFDLMNQGRYEEAIPVLQQAVDALSGSGGLTYAYALYNLGRSLRLGGPGRRGDPGPRAAPRDPQPARRSSSASWSAARREAGQG